MGSFCENHPQGNMKRIFNEIFNIIQYLMKYSLRLSLVSFISHMEWEIIQNLFDSIFIILSKEYHDFPQRSTNYPNVTFSRDGTRVKCSEIFTEITIISRNSQSLPQPLNLCFHNTTA